MPSIEYIILIFFDFHFVSILNKGAKRNMKKKMWIILAAAVVVLAVVIWLLCLNSGLKQDKNDLTAQLADAAKTASQLQLLGGLWSLT